MFAKKHNTRFTAEDAQKLVKQYQPPLDYILNAIREAATRGDIYIRRLALERDIARDLESLGFQVDYSNPNCVTISWPGAKE